MLADLAAVDLARTCFQPVADGNMVEALQLTDHLQFQPLLDDAYAVVQKENKIADQALFVLRRTTRPVAIPTALPSVQRNKFDVSLNAAGEASKSLLRRSS